MLMKFKQIHGGMELVNDVEVLKAASNISEISEKCVPQSNILRLTHNPDINRGIILEVNGVSYLSPDSFIYIGGENIIKWTRTEFSLDENDSIVVRYFTQIS